MSAKRQKSEDLINFSSDGKKPAPTGGLADPLTASEPIKPLSIAPAPILIFSSAGNLEQNIQHLNKNKVEHVHQLAALLDIETHDTSSGSSKTIAKEILIYRIYTKLGKCKDIRFDDTDSKWILEEPDFGQPAQ